MEVFSMLRYWRGGGTKGGAGSGGGGATTISATSLPPTYDEGPFFDLEFSVPDEESEDGTICPGNGREENEGRDEEGRESTDIKSIEITVSNDEQAHDADNGEEDLLITGQLVSVDQSSSDGKSNEEPTESPVSILKPATKFRVFLLGLKKHASSSPATSPEKMEEVAGEGKGKAEHHQSGRFFTVKFKVEEVPLVSLFTRDGSRSGSKAKEEESPGAGENSDKEAVEKDARRAKVAVQRYLKAIKPLYDRVSRKTQGERVSFSCEPGAASQPKDAESSPVDDGEPAKQGGIPTGLRVAYKHLGKIRPGVTVPSPATPVVLKAQRRDDSLLQQEDGIQSAIAYCKRSFNAPSEEVATMVPPLPQPVS